MTLFGCLITFVVAQRLVELIIAKRNEKVLKKKGAIEVGEEHYKWIILLHVLFFASLIVEVYVRHIQFTYWSFVPLALFIAAQSLRLWSLYTLGEFWNTKIIVLPGESVIASGPYRYLKHPNYLVVAIEIFTLPLMFHAYFTMIAFSLLNALVIVMIRIPDEEKALAEVTDYHKKMSNRKRFVPTPPRK